MIIAMGMAGGRARASPDRKPDLADHRPVRRRGGRRRAAGWLVDMHGIRAGFGAAVGAGAAVLAIVLSGALRGRDAGASSAA